MNVYEVLMVAICVNYFRDWLTGVMRLVLINGCTGKFRKDICWLWYKGLKLRAVLWVVTDISEETLAFVFTLNLPNPHVHYRENLKSPIYKEGTVKYDVPFNISKTKFDMR
jgi:hypothetical protein